MDESRRVSKHSRFLTQQHTRRSSRLQRRLRSPDFVFLRRSEAGAAVSQVGIGAVFRRRAAEAGMRTTGMRHENGRLSQDRHTCACQPGAAADSGGSSMSPPGERGLWRREWSVEMEWISHRVSLHFPFSSLEGMRRTKRKRSGRSGSCVRGVGRFAVKCQDGASSCACACSRLRPP